MKDKSVLNVVVIQMAHIIITLNHYYWQVVCCCRISIGEDVCQDYLSLLYDCQQVALQVCVFKLTSEALDKLHVVVIKRF